MDPEQEKTIRLVEAAQNGDDDAREALFARYLPRVRQIVAFRLGYRLRDFGIHEDLVQDAMVRALTNLDGFEERSEGTFRNWIACCVQSAINDHFRKLGAKKRGAGKERPASSYGDEDFSLTLFAGKDPTPSAIARGAELLEKIESALLNLEEHHREVILLRRFCEMSYAEIARDMGFENETSVRKIFSRAMKQLQKEAGIDLDGSTD